MANLNKVFLIGNLTQDPKLMTKSPTPVVRFGLAVNQKYRQDSQEKESVCFVDIVAFSKLAEVCAQYLKKGRAVFIEGKLQLNIWEQTRPEPGRREGQKRNKLEVVARKVQFLSKPKPGNPE